MKPITYLVVFLLLLASFAFVYGIYEACKISWPEHPDISKMSAFLSSVVVSIAAILATNLGAVLGISTVDSKSAFRRSFTWNPLNIFSSEAPNVSQTIACYIYVLGLLAAAIVWARKNFIEADVVALIPQLTKSLVGVVVGALAVALSVQRH
jgi:hypothetical protein